MSYHIFFSRYLKESVNIFSLSSGLKLILALLTYLLFQHTTFAEPVSQPGINNLVSLADYRAGDDDKPAILIMHGFLQTHNFSIIQSISNEMADNGYTVLAPTLSLGIDRRKQSITCDMIQTHQYNDHNAELEIWVNWLQQKGHKKIILIGHSTGAVRILSYSSQHLASNNNIIGLILISPTLPTSANEAVEIKKQLNKAYSLVKNNNNELNKFTLAYCVNSYISSASAFSSYASISETDFYSHLKESKHPVSIILGSDDKLIPDDWYNKLKSRDARIIQIEGANHFYTNGHEFDLFDTINNTILKLDN